MNDKNRQNIGRDCAYIAVFVALTIAAQLCLSFVPGVEVVTVLFVTFSFAFGCRHGIVAATAFSFSTISKILMPAPVEKSVVPT